MLKPLTVWITTDWEIHKKMGIPDHLTCLLRNLYAGQEATVRTLHGTGDWFKIEKEVVHQGCILSLCFFNLHEGAAAAKSLQSCPTLCDPIDSSLPGSSIHGTLQARVLEWGAIEYIMQNAGLDESQAGIKTARRNINLRYADDTTFNSRK